MLQRAAFQCENGPRVSTSTFLISSGINLYLFSLANVLLLNASSKAAGEGGNSAEPAFSEIQVRWVGWTEEGE